MLADADLIAALTPLIIALAGLILQELKRRDTNKHGDAFIDMLKNDVSILESVSSVLPSVEPYVKEYKDLVLEAEKIWNSGGITATNIQFISMKASFYKTQIENALAKYRELRKTGV